MDDLLSEHGFEKTEDLDVLAFELGTDPEPKLPGLRVPAGVRTRLVRDESDLRRANTVEAGVFPTSTWDERDTHAYLQGISELEGRGSDHPGEDDASHVLRYLASVQETEGEGWEVVATAGAEVAGETVRLWGAYRALVLERCRHAHVLGATLALTKANTFSSAPILRTTGFRPVARERRYALKMCAPAAHEHNV